MATARSITQRKHGLTLVGGNPDAGPVITGAPSEVAHGAGAAWDDITAGRISLGILGSLVVLALGFYVWTNSIQGGG
jgi:hypothetical protein